jgi:chromosome partitioning protein
MAQITNNDFLLSTSDLATFVGLTPKQCLGELEALAGTLPYKSLVPPQLVRRYLSSKGYQYPQQVVSFQMLKGGVAKTTSALNFGLRAAMYGASVLFVDLDQQANLSFALGVEDEARPVWVDVVEKKVKVSEALVSIDENVDLIPSSLNNSVLDRVLLSGSRNWAQAVKTPLKEVQGQYDLVIIDTAPNLSAINTAVTCASDVVVLPINPDKFSLSGMKKHLADLQELKNEFDLQFVEKILFTKFDGRESSSREILSQVAEDFSEQLMSHYIRTSSDIKNSIGSSKTIFNSKSHAKEDYDLVTRELLGFLR